MDSRALAAKEWVKELMKRHTRIAISAVLADILEWGTRAEPRLIVELGVSREALANKVLAAIAQRFNAVFISCDLGDFSNECFYPRWFFNQGDDVEFGEVFREYGASIGVDPIIDLLFIDTDELYEHTQREIETWYPFLSKRCTVMHRCTNLKRTLVYRDGSKTNLGWDNERGVIRVLEGFLGIKIDETIEQERMIGEWTMVHLPWGAGLTVLRRGYE